MIFAIAAGILLAVLVLGLLRALPNLLFIALAIWLLGTFLVPLFEHPQHTQSDQHALVVGGPWRK